VKELHVSQITDYQTCPRMYKYRYVDWLVPMQPPTKLAIGTIAHAGVAAFNRGEDPFGAVDAALTQEIARIREVAAAVGAPVDTSELEKQAELVPELVQAYMDYHAANNDGIKMTHVEQPFAVPVVRKWGARWRRSGISYVGTFDGIAEDRHGRLWVWENKFLAQFPSEITLRLDLQCGYYLMAARMLFPNREVTGIVYDVVRKVNPVKARTPVVARYMVTRNDVEVQHLMERLPFICNQIDTDKLYMPQPGLHCSWKCRYTDLCVAEEDGSGVDALKAALYVRREPPRVLTEEEAV